jgi:hypothetical protein
VVSSGDLATAPYRTLFILGGFGPLVDPGQPIKQVRSSYFACLVILIGMVWGEILLAILRNAVRSLGNMEVLAWLYDQTGSILRHSI